MSRGRSESIAVVVVLLAFAGLTTWLLHATETKQAAEYAPLTTRSPQADGAKALYELLSQSGARPQRFYDTEYHYPPGACLVMLNLDDPLAMMFGGVDAKAVRLWLQRGGRLVLCASSDDPLVDKLLEELKADKADTKHPQLDKLAVKLTGTGPGKQGKLSALSRVEQNGEQYVLPKNSPLLFAGVHQIEIASATEPTAEAVTLLGDPTSVLLYRKVGKGELYWLTRPEMASNAWIARADNHRLLLAVIGAASRGAPVYFDEHIHGYLRESPNLLALLTHTHGGHMLLLLIGLTLLLYAGAAVRPAKFAVETVPARRAGTEMVLAQADLYQRAGAQHVIADSQVDSLRRAFMEQRHLASPPSDEQILEWVEHVWQGQPKGVLAEYLRTRLLPRTQAAMLELARACDEARAVLS